MNEHKQILFICLRVTKSNQVENRDREIGIEKTRIVGFVDEDEES